MAAVNQGSTVAGPRSGRAQALHGQRPSGTAADTGRESEPTQAHDPDTAAAEPDPDTAGRVPAETAALRRRQDVGDMVVRAGTAFEE